ncbi:MAG: NERD domain-containing protein [Ruminiclostridium sp.]|nr:NERD domain-containing protein [Ruminiclostridium sp.]
MITAIIVLILVYFLVIRPEKEFKKTTYYKITHNTLSKTRSDVGCLGEYMCYKYLADYENTGARFLFNVYIPRDDTTTEIDVLMIHHTGLYVLESKNYDGWIFGTDTNTNWIQSLPQGHKSIKKKFYNPIMQNNTHIKYLKKQVGESVPCHNIVVFSERCTLKSITIKPDAEYKVIQRNNLRQTVDEMTSRQPVLSPEQIEAIFNQLYPYTQVKEEVKQAHIQQINQRYNTQQNMAAVPVQPVVSSANTAPSVNTAVESKPLAFVEEATDFFCPDCGAAIVLRTYQGGQNAGKQLYCCINNPNCGYIKEKK